MSILSYPVLLTQDENDCIIATFPDVPEAITLGYTEEEALKWAKDALMVALSGYLDDQSIMPTPSKIINVYHSVEIDMDEIFKLSNKEI